MSRRAVRQAAAKRRGPSTSRLALRWGVALLVSVAAFAAAMWISGALAVPMRDGGVRWAIAIGVGSVVGTLAASWGTSYANAKDEQPASEPGKAEDAAVGESHARFSITGGTFHAPVMQGHDIAIINLTSHGTSSPPPATDEAVESPPTES